MMAPEISASVALWRDESPAYVAFRRFFRHRLAVAGAIVLLVVITLAVFAPLIAKYPPDYVDLNAIRQAPTTLHWLGTDSAGRDVWARVLAAGRVSLLVGVVAALISVLIGTMLGALAGILGGAMDTVLMRLTDIVLSIPTIVVIV